MSTIHRLQKWIWQPSDTISNGVRKAMERYSKATFQAEAPYSKLMEEDWDNVIILDACRYDQFERLNPIEGELESRTSPGTYTTEFLRANFEGQSFHDTVVVTANPKYRKPEFTSTFHDVIDVWDFGWDKDKKTVLPNTMAEASIKAYEKYPNKRLIIHFMQPHYPFIGEAAEEIGDHAGYGDAIANETGSEEFTDVDPTVWTLINKGEIDEDLVWRAYNETLEIAFEHVERMVEYFDERTVITSDHGNAVGERLCFKRVYGHPVGIHMRPIRHVPWLIVEGSKRKRITSGSPATIPKDQNRVNERLAHLGYIDEVKSDYS